MPEQPITPPANAGGESNGTPAPTNADNPGATDPNQKTGSGNSTQDASVPDVDFSKLSDKQLEKVLEDQRLWKHPRIAELREKAGKAKEYEAAEAKKAEEAAIKKGEFDSVLKTKDARISDLETQLKNQAIDLQLTSELNKLGVTNLQAALRLVDRDSITVGEDGKLSGVEDTLNSFKSQFPELVQKTTTNVGSGTNPTDVDPNNGVFKLSQINDPVFYAKNHVAIKKAMASGKIIDDLAPMTPS